MWGGGGHPLPAMQCWAASTNHLPAVSEGGWARIWGQPRRVLGQTEWERISERGKQLCLVLQESSYSRASAVLFLFATPFLCNLCFLVIKDCLLFIPHSAFHPLLLLHFPSVFLFFSLCGWSERFLLNICTPSCPPPCTTSHGHPCFLQVRAGGMFEDEQTVYGLPWERSSSFWCWRNLEWTQNRMN